MTSKRCYIVCSTAALNSRVAVKVSHYAGITRKTTAERLLEHAAGRGAKITAAFIRAGGVLTITRIWGNATRYTEKAIKAYGKLNQLCPKCSGTMKYKPKGFKKGKRIK
jgi:predicted GIY-YIG superfamily endonuclease